MATSDDSEIATNLGGLHITQPTEAQVIAALNEYRRYVRQENRAGLEFCIRRVMEREFEDSDDEAIASDSEDATSEHEDDPQRQQHKLKKEHKYQLEWLASTLGTEFSEDISTPWEVLERFDELVCPCGLDGVYVNFWRLDEEEHARKREEWKRVLLAELRRKAAPEVAADLELPLDLCFLLQEVDALLAWGLPEYRSYHQPDFIDGLTVDIPDITTKVLTLSELSETMEWGWEAGAGWESSDGGCSGVRGQTIYCRKGEGPWQWRYHLLSKGNLLVFDNVVELLRHATHFREAEYSELPDFNLF